MLDFCVNTHFSAAKIRFFDEFTKDFCVNTHFSAVKSVFIICSCAHLLERILSPANLNRAYKAVMRNKGM